MQRTVRNQQSTIVLRPSSIPIYNLQYPIYNFTVTSHQPVVTSKKAPAAGRFRIFDILYLIFNMPLEGRETVNSKLKTHNSKLLFGVLCALCGKILSLIPKIRARSLPRTPIRGGSKWFKMAHLWTTLAQLRQTLAHLCACWYQDYHIKHPQNLIFSPKTKNYQTNPILL